MENELLELKNTLGNLESDLNQMGGKILLFDKYGEDIHVKAHRNRYNFYFNKYGVDVGNLSELKDAEIIKLDKEEIEYKSMVFGSKLLIKLMTAIRDAYYKEMSGKISN